MADFSFVDVREGVALAVEGPEDLELLDCKDLKDVRLQPCLVAAYTSSVNDKTTTWSFPWSTEGSFVNVRDEDDNLYLAATAEGALTYFCAETEKGRQVILDARQPQPQVQSQLCL